MRTHNVSRTIKCVLDKTDPDEPTIRDADAYLNSLSAPHVTLTRFTETIAKQNKAPVFACGQCGGPVFIKVRACVHTDTVSGRRAFFAHRSTPGAQVCPWYTGPTLDPHAIDAVRFSGAQEGQRHHLLKLRLAAVLAKTGFFTDIRVEQVVSAGGARRTPDVLARTVDGRWIAFDVQLVPPQVPTIVGREAFYATLGIGYLWIVDASASDRLQLQGFQDLAWPQGGIVLGFDEELAEISEEQGELVLRRFQLSHPRGTETINVESSLEKQASVLECAGVSRGIPATSLRERWMLDLVNHENVDDLPKLHNLYAQSLQLPPYSEACPSGLFRCLKVALNLSSVGLGLTLFRPSVRGQLLRFLQDPEMRKWSWLFYNITSISSAARDEIGPDIQSLLLRNIRNTPQNARFVEDSYKPLIEILFPGLSNRSLWAPDND